MTGQLSASLSKLSRIVYLCPLPLLAQWLSCHALSPSPPSRRLLGSPSLALSRALSYGVLQYLVGQLG
jgi:hypothetical protein